MEDIYNDLCRLCLQNGKVLLPIFERNSANDNISDKIVYCTIVKVDENDGFPRNICTECSTILKQFYEFRQMCENSDLLLHETKESFLKIINIKANPYSSQSLGDKLIIPSLLKKNLESNIYGNCLLKKATDYMKALDSKNDTSLIPELYCQINIKSECEEEEHETESGLPEQMSEELKGLEKSDKKDKKIISVRHRYKAKPNNVRSKKINIIRTHQATLKNNLSVHCEECNQTFESPEKLREHNKSTHSRRFTCLYCNKTFRSVSARTEHMQIHEPENEIITCNICSKECRSKKALRAHMLTHTGVLKVNCEVCRRTFSSPANMRRHMMIHLNQRPHMCHFCGISFNQSGTRDAHIMAKHSPEKIYRCNMCTMRFETKELLEKHNSRHDTHGEGAGEFPMIPTCKECNKSFATQANLKNHMNWHNKPYLCIVCGKGFANKHALKNHERSHTGERPFACTYCTKEFTMRVLLKAHMRSHTNEDDKKFLCPYCPKKFALRSTLKTHTYIHTGERPYKCTMCDKDFNQNAHLRTHLFTHTGEKKHVCDICNKAFALKEGLRYHIMTHTGETPFICTQCGRGFYIQYKLKIHMLKSHNIQLKTEIKS